MKRNILGLSLCGVYCATTAACWLVAYAPDSDDDGRLILKQLPIALQLGLLDWLGFSHFLRKLSWFQAYALLFPSTLGFLYGLGWLTTRRSEDPQRRPES